MGGCVLMSEHFDVSMWGKSKSTKALERFLSDMDLRSPKMDDEYLLRLAEVRALLDSHIRVGFKRLDESAIIPTKAHVSDSGFDLYALEDTIIEPGETKVIPTGIAVSLPAGYEAQVRPRSGVTAKTKLRVQLGTIDNGYAGEIGVIVDNKAVGKPRFDENWYALGVDGKSVKTCKHYAYKSYLIRKGDRLAQLVVQPLPAVQAYEIEGDIEQTERGARSEEHTSELQSRGHLVC